MDVTEVPKASCMPPFGRLLIVTNTSRISVLPPPLDPKFRTIPPHSKAKYSDHTTTSSTTRGRVVDLCHYLSRFPLGAWCCHLRSRNGRELSATHGRPWPNDAPAAAAATTTTAAKSEWPCCDPNPIDNL